MLEIFSSKNNITYTLAIGEARRLLESLEVGTSCVNCVTCNTSVVP